MEIFFASLALYVENLPLIKVSHHKGPEPQSCIGVRLSLLLNIEQTFGWLLNLDALTPMWYHSKDNLVDTT